MLRALPLLLLLGCAAAPSTDLSAPGWFSRLHFEVAFAGGVAVSGSNDLEVTLTDHEEDTPAAGMTVLGHAHMPSMDHEVEEVAFAEGEAGVYAATLVFPMPGTWELHLEAEGEELSDEVTFDLDVE